MTNNMNRTRNRITKLFISVPILFATFSIFHLITFLSLGSHSILAIGMGITFEVANIVAVLIFVILKKINKPFVWTTFIILILMQIIGNVYAVFDFIQQGITSDAGWVRNYTILVQYIAPNSSDIGIAFWLSAMIGAVSPIIALLLTKSVAGYLAEEPAIESPVVPIVETPKVEAPVTPVVESVKTEMPIEIIKPGSVPVQEPIIQSPAPISSGVIAG